jgi:hypothetical protein
MGINYVIAAIISQMKTIYKYHLQSITWKLIIASLSKIQSSDNIRYEGLRTVEEFVLKYFDAIK